MGYKNDACVTYSVTRAQGSNLAEINIVVENIPHRRFSEAEHKIVLFLRKHTFKPYMFSRDGVSVQIHTTKLTTIEAVEFWVRILMRALEDLIHVKVRCMQIARTNLQSAA